MTFLNTDWFLRCEAASTPASMAADTWPTLLPMDVRTCLARVGAVPDPRFGTQSTASDWIARHRWIFSRTITMSHDRRDGLRHSLKLRGLDHDAEVRLDGKVVAHLPTHSQVAWIELPADEHHLELILRPVPEGELEETPDGPRWRLRTAHAKPPIFAGGDHNPFLANAGMSHVPELIAWRHVLLRHVRLDWTWDGDSTIGGAIIVDALVTTAVEVVIELLPDGHDGPAHRLLLQLTPGDGCQSLPFTCLQVARWWPRSLGTPHCHRLLVHGDAGQQIERVVGFRSVEYRRCDAFIAQPVPSVFAWHPYENNGPYGIEYFKGYDALAEAGESWPVTPREGTWDLDLHINGERMWIAGGAVTPPTLFWSEWNSHRQVALAQRAVECGLNTLRIWGGGVMLDDAFYSACDRLGLLVIHDYLNFCGQVPHGWQAQLAHEAKTRAEARHMSNHPSIVVVTGGNELFQNPGNRPAEPRQRVMERITREEIPHVVFRDSCPVNPEVHGPWLYNLDHAARYASQCTPLNSECGVMGLPSKATLTRMLPPEDLEKPFSSAWFHRAPDQGYFRTLTGGAALFGPLAQVTLDDAIARTQYIQALGYQILVEEFRRQRPANVGVIIWEFSEPWGDLNWGLISNDLVPKAAFHAFRRATQPDHASIRLRSPVVAAGGAISADIYVHRDHGNALAASLEIHLISERGEVLAQQRYAGVTDGPALKLGTFHTTAPASGAVCLALRGQLADGTALLNEQWLNVLPTLQRAAKPRVLIITGGSYEDHVTLEFLAAAGLDLHVVHASPTKPCHEPDPSTFAAVVIAPLFDPVASLSQKFLTRLRSAPNTGLLYVGYNTSAYVSGRFNVQSPLASALEDLLPMTFAEDCYGNSADKFPNPPLTRTADHPCWEGIELSHAPTLGRRVRMLARPTAQILGDCAGEPVIAANGRRIACTLPWGGHQFQGMDFRNWPHGQRLLSNLVEFVATGAVIQRSSSAHPFAPLTTLPSAELAVTITSTGTASWQVTVRNIGGAPALGVEVVSNHANEGASFDWHANDGGFTLLAGEKRHISCHATSAEETILSELKPQVRGWNCPSA